MKLPPFKPNGMIWLIKKTNTCYGARLLAPLFAAPKAWVVLEVVVGLTMWAIAATLVLG